MTDNPYQPPETTAHVAGDMSKSRPTFIWYAVLAILAVVEGGSAYLLFDGKPPSSFVTGVFFATPVIAILFSAFFPLFYSGSLALGDSAGRLAGAIVLTILISAAGYVCFVTTCCCTNLVAGSVSIEGPSPVALACAVGGFISAATMVFSCLGVAAITRAVLTRVGQS